VKRGRIIGKRRSRRKRRGRMSERRGEEGENIREKKK
jgi:hypothetical protein